MAYCSTSKHLAYRERQLTTQAAPRVEHQPSYLQRLVHVGRSIQRELEALQECIA